MKLHLVIAFFFSQHTTLHFMQRLNCVNTSEITSCAVTKIVICPPPGSSLLYSKDGESSERESQKLF